MKTEGDYFYEVQDKLAKRKSNNGNLIKHHKVYVIAYKFTDNGGEHCYDAIRDSKERIDFYLKRLREDKRFKDIQVRTIIFKFKQGE